jgi:hypothetical protein
MNVATLRLEGDAKDLALAATRLGLRPEQEWKQGEKSRAGTLHRSSGYSSTIADVSTPANLLSAIRAFIAKCQENATTFSNVRAELSIGVAVGDSEQFMALIEFSPSDLQAIAALGLTLSIAAYPTSDEANNEVRAI